MYKWAPVSCSGVAAFDLAACVCTCSSYNELIRPLCSLMRSINSFHNRLVLHHYIISAFVWRENRWRIHRGTPSTGYHYLSVLALFLIPAVSCLQGIGALNSSYSVQCQTGDEPVSHNCERTHAKIFIVVAKLLRHGCVQIISCVLNLYH